MSKVVQYMSRVYGVEYRVLLAIDDLDRCQGDRIMSMLQAISLLLDEDGQEDSPYISIIAIDPKIIVAAVEQHFEAQHKNDSPRALVNG